MRRMQVDPSVERKTKLSPVPEEERTAKTMAVAWDAGRWLWRRCLRKSWIMKTRRIIAIRRLLATRFGAAPTAARRWASLGVSGRSGRVLSGPLPALRRPIRLPRMDFRLRHKD